MRIYMESTGSLLGLKSWTCDYSNKLPGSIKDVVFLHQVPGSQGKLSSMSSLVFVPRGLQLFSDWSTFAHTTLSDIYSIRSVKLEITIRSVCGRWDVAMMRLGKMSDYDLWSEWFDAQWSQIIIWHLWLISL